MNLSPPPPAPESTLGPPVPAAAVGAGASEGARPVAGRTRGSELMIAGSIAFGLMAVALRLATAQVSSSEAAFFRSLFGLLFSLPLLYGPGLALLHTRNFHLYIVRSLFGALAMLSGFWALAHLPLAQAVSIAYSTPLFVTIAAVFVLGEVVRLRRWTAVIAGFAGVLIIMRPGTAQVSLDMLVALAGAALSAGSYISIKFLARSEPPDAVVIYMNLIITPLALVPALWSWTWPDAIGWLWLLLTGLLGTIGQFFMTRAYNVGEVSALIPLSFLQLPVVVIFAWFLFGERLDLTTLIGASVIVTANVYIARREARLARAPARREPPA